MMGPWGLGRKFSGALSLSVVFVLTLVASVLMTRFGQTLESGVLTILASGVAVSWSAQVGGQAMVDKARGQP